MDVICEKNATLPIIGFLFLGPSKLRSLGKAL